MLGPTERDLKRWQEQGDALLATRRFAEARPFYERILAAVADDLYVIYQLTLTLEGLGDLQGAAAVCDRGLQLDPHQPGLRSRRAAIARNQGQYVLALELYRSLAASHPDFPYLDAMIADQLALLGRGEEAIESFNRALALTPDNVQIQSDRLFVLNYFGLLDRKQLFEEHRSWGVRHERLLKSTWGKYAQSREPERKLRVAYVSPDLRRHAVAYFIEGILSEHDHVNFEINAIDVSPHREDEVTKRLRKLVDHWHRLGDKNDNELAEIIRRIHVDILVDLSGHTAHNRLLVFARKPAPVQVSWFGYMNTTGLTSIDYRLTDAALDPIGQSEEFYTERLFRIPSAACFQPDVASPTVGPLPAFKNGFVTMGSLNQWTKVTDATKDAWAVILGQVPTAKLKVFARGGDDPRVRAAIIEEFERRNVAQGRLQIIGFRPIHEFLNSLTAIDFALDPFPYGGGTTSLHSAWMGVPIVAMRSDSELGRSSPSILSGLGLGELIAETPTEYAEIAVGLCNDLSRLAAYRRELRPRFLASSLCDPAAVTRSVESAFREMWRTFCANAGRPT